jgi:hypothetical protein
MFDTVPRTSIRAEKQHGGWRKLNVLKMEREKQSSNQIEKKKPIKRDGVFLRQRTTNPFPW